MIFTILDTLKIKKLVIFENIYSLNPLYLIIGSVDGHIEEKNGSKHLVLVSTDKNKKVSKKNTKNFGMELKMKLKQSMVAKKVNMVKIL